MRYQLSEKPHLQKLTALFLSELYNNSIHLSVPSRLLLNQVQASTFILPHTNQYYTYTQHGIIIELAEQS